MTGRRADKLQVFVNKRIFEDQALRHAQVTFAALHFAVTAGTLYVASTSRISMFQRKRVPVLEILPLALAMIASVVLTNASLAFSSIQFYQVARVLTTPCVALLEYIILRKKITMKAGLTLIPVCVGVGVVSYFDTSAKATSTTRATSPLGVFFAFISLFATATYSVWIKKYHQTTGCESAQLLLNQSPISVLVMLYIIPFSDDVTVWRSVSLSTWSIILLVSGLVTSETVRLARVQLTGVHRAASWLVSCIFRSSTLSTEQAQSPVLWLDTLRHASSSPLGGPIARGHSRTAVWSA